MAKAATATATTRNTSTAVTKAKVNLPVDLNAQLQAEMAEIQKRISAPSGDRIMVTQGKTFKMPNGDELDELEAIVVDFAAANYYYVDAFDRNNIVPPACFALGLEPAGLTASDNSPDKQCDSCASCWANQFGTAGKGKACQNTRLLALLPPDADVETPIMILKVSPTAIKSFDAHVGNVARATGMPVRTVITRVSFSEDEYASVRFSTLSAADKEQIMLAQSRLEEARVRILTEPDVSAQAASEPKKISAKKPAAKKVTRRAT